MIVEPKVREFICTTAHPQGCKENVKEQNAYVKEHNITGGPKKVLVIGASTGYGLASRITAAFGCHAATLGIMFEKPSNGKRTATPGWYNTAAFEEEAAKEGLYAKSINGDAFSKEVKEQAVSMIKADFGKIDMVIYSLAAPRRTDAQGKLWVSTLKTTDEPFTEKSLDLRTNTIVAKTVEPAEEGELEGTIKVMGKDPFSDRIENAKKIGVVFGQKTQLWWDIPVEETFRLLKKIYEIPEEQYIKNMEKFSNILGLREFMNQPARKLSLGQRVRADLAAALLHDPPILFLDEPTIGIDVAVKQKIYVFLKEINRERKTTILLTSHDMKDLESLCDRLIILEKGEILFDNKMNRLFEIYGESLSLEEIIIELFEHRRVS